MAARKPPPPGRPPSSRAPRHRRRGAAKPAVGAERRAPRRKTSVYRGVTVHRWTGKYEAHIWDKYGWNASRTKRGKQVYLGAFDDEETAARAHDLASIKYWGPRTALNFPIDAYRGRLQEMERMSREEYLLLIRRRSSGFSRGVSKYRGVTRHHHTGRWEARLGRFNGTKYLYLGTFATQEAAAEAYDMAALRHRGPRAVTNFDPGRYKRRRELEEQEEEEEEEEEEDEEEEEEEEAAAQDDGGIVVPMQEMPELNAEDPQHDMDAARRLYGCQPRIWGDAGRRFGNGQDEAPPPFPPFTAPPPHGVAQTEGLIVPKQEMVEFKSEKPQYDMNADGVGNFLGSDQPWELCMEPSAGFDPFPAPVMSLDVGHLDGVYDHPRFEENVEKLFEEKKNLVGSGGGGGVAYPETTALNSTGRHNAEKHVRAAAGADPSSSSAAAPPPPGNTISG